MLGGATKLRNCEVDGRDHCSLDGAEMQNYMELECRVWDVPMKWQTSAAAPSVV